MCRVLGEGMIRRTRKDHHCAVCGKKIPAGEACYWQTNTGWEGADFGTVYWCLGCDIASASSE